MVQKIIVAAGIEIRDFQGNTLLAYLNANADVSKASVWTYPKGAGAKATHQVEVVYTMAELATALDTQDAYVIYEGHSRYGQGPAFGPANTPHVPDKKTFPTNPWGVHFRMGFDATDTECVGDLLEHSVNPAEYDLTAPPSKAFLPSVLEKAAIPAQTIAASQKAGKLSKTQKANPCSIRGAWRELNVCDAVLAASKTARGDEPLKGRHYYAKKVGVRKKIPKDEYFTAVKVGSIDLDKSALKCTVLFMASCSSHVHFFKPLAKRRTAAKSACKFYMTGEVCSATHGKNFIEQVFKGHDPISKKGSKTILKALNGADDSGNVGFF